MPEPDTVLPVVQESLSIDKRRLVTGRTRIETVTETVEEFVKADLESVSVEIERVPVGAVIDSIPGIRVEGDVTIVPVVEEVLVVEKRLVLREEIRLTRLRRSEAVAEPVRLRKQRAVVTRLPASGARPSEAEPSLSSAIQPMENDMMDYGSNRHLTALFDTQAAAESAVERLRALGLSETSIRMTGGEEVSGRVEENKGFWESISDFFFPDDERATYAEGLRRGGYLVSVSGIPEDRFDEAIDILDDEGSVDLDARSEEWRAEGWSGAPIGADGISTAGDADLTAALADERDDAAARRSEGDYAASGADTTPAEAFADRPAMGGAGMGAAGMAAAGMGASGMGATEAGRTESGMIEPDVSGIGATGTGRMGDDEVIPVVEERLRVGKRDVNLGRVRVRSYVVETPVSEDVSLRSDRVEIERRPVDRALDAGDAAFTDRVIEAEEHAEEAVIQKEARVTEEIGLRKTSEEHTETVSDTVRHTEVEVEDERDALSRDPARRA